MKKLIVAFLGVLLVGAPALAQTLTYDRNDATSLREIAQRAYTSNTDSNIHHTRGLIMDDDCTDSQSLDADLQPVPNGVDFAPATGPQDDGFDTFAEAINPKLNYGYGPQTSGSADGWCDEAPWILAADITVDGNEQIIIGPFLADAPGLQLVFSVSAMTGTSFQPQLAIPNPGNAADIVQLGAGTASTASSGIDQWVFSPWDTLEANNSQVTATDSVMLSPGDLIWLRLQLTGAGNFDWDISILPVYGESQFDIDQP
jgi:hypothetical protein